jgi:hypothetical protein
MPKFPELSPGQSSRMPKFPQILKHTPRRSNDVYLDSFILDPMSAYCQVVNGCTDAAGVVGVLKNVALRIQQHTGIAVIYALSPLVKAYAKDARARQFRVHGFVMLHGNWTRSAMPLWVLYGLEVDGSLPTRHVAANKHTVMQRLHQETQTNGLGHFGLIYNDRESNTRKVLQATKFIAMDETITRRAGFLDAEELEFKMTEYNRMDTLEYHKTACTGRIQKARASAALGVDYAKQQIPALELTLKELKLDEIPYIGRCTFSPYALDPTPNPHCCTLQAVGIPLADNTGIYSHAFFQSFLRDYAPFEVKTRPFQNGQLVTLIFPPSVMGEDTCNTSVLARDFLYWHSNLGVPDGPHVRFETLDSVLKKRQLTKQTNKAAKNARKDACN